MAIYTPHLHSDETLAAARAWKDRCLQDDGSIFSEQALWTEDNLSRLKAAFNERPIEGTDKFYVKLRRQLQDASSEVQQLAAECLWLLLLFVSSEGFGAGLKRQRVEEVWSLGGTELPSSELLSVSALEGIGWPGAAFLTRIPDEYGFLILIVLAWKRLPAGQREQLLMDGEPWPFCEWVTSQPGGDRRIFRHILLYLLYPASFERICSRKQKRQIYTAFRAELGDGLELGDEPRTPCDLDRAVLQIRQVLVSQHGTDEIDFYNEPLKEIWGFAAAAQPTSDIPAARRYWIEKTLVAGRPDRESGEHALGRALWSPQRAAGGQDIYATMRQIRAGDVVLHLTDNRAITAASIAAGDADDSFNGVTATDWADQPSYRIALEGFQPLEPPLARRSFLETEPFRTQLAELLRSGTKGLFFNRNLELNQGAYLTEATPELLSILNAAYRAQSEKDLPYVDHDAAGDDNIIAVPDVSLGLEDLFLEPAEVAAILALWRAKKNVILQGPPGVGKSFAAQRLAYALMGAADSARLGFVQFHQSYAYEDFVEGFRPTASGFELRRGKFVDFCRKASADLGRPYVFIIDEINRGNLSKILGELMLLIESDKRSSDWEMPLAYGSEKFHVPANVHLLGLMNTADRSLAVVDYALRRRFAFVDLRPKLHSPKLSAALAAKGVGPALQAALLQRVGALNSVIEEDLASLGPGFSIGHSFFCAGPATGEAADGWYRRVISTEILPLLREYWFDAPHTVSEWEGRLLAPV